MPKTKEKAPSGVASKTGHPSDKLDLQQGKSITQNPKLQAKCITPEQEISCTLETDFVPRKTKSFDLSEVFYRLSEENDVKTFANFQETELTKGYFERRGIRTENCASFLEWAFEIDENGNRAEKAKLHRANFCKDRLCPMCAWRRSYKIFGQVSQIMELIGRNYKFLLLTLTVPNCNEEDLPETLNRLVKSSKKLFDYKRIKKVVRGYFRALEVTYNKEADTYHPHFHFVLAVPLGYCSNADYIKQSEWLDMWRKAYKDESITNLDIRVCKEKKTEKEKSARNFLGSAVAEVTKYAVKAGDYLFEDMELSKKVVKTLALALEGRRLASFAGCFKEAFRQLKLEDAESESADLEHLDGELNLSLAWMIVKYGWTCGTYKMTETFIEMPEEHKKKGK